MNADGFVTYADADADALAMRGTQVASSIGIDRTHHCFPGVDSASSQDSVVELHPRPSHLDAPPKSDVTLQMPWIL